MSCGAIPAKIWSSTIKTMTAADFRRLALSLPEVVEGSHFGQADFRAGGKIFATLSRQSEGYGVLLLTPEQQAGMIEDEPSVFSPVPSRTIAVNRSRGIVRRPTRPFFSTKCRCAGGGVA